MEKVLVTGGSGYIALHCIAELLKENYHVRTSLRNMERKEEVQKSVSKYLNENNSLEFCKLDLLIDDGWDNAVNGCEYVLHLASPVYEKDNSDESAFIEPAEQGLLRALRPSVEQKVKRFVMTSSIAAITQGHEEEKIDEKFWSKIEDSTMPYIKSKTLAEKALWNYINNLKDEEKIEVCTINPSFVFGPSLSDDMGASNLLIRGLLVGKLPALANIQFNVVSVQDVARAHVLAMKSPKAPGNRFIVSEKALWMVDIAKILKKSGFKKVPTKVMPNFFLWFLAIFLKDIALFKDRLSKSQTTDASNAKKVLNWNPSNVEDAIIATAKQYQARKERG